jgi:drug/metabolite transporter (DMT)-like permease
MATHEPTISSRVEQELLRLTFCGIVIASFFAVMGASRDLNNLLSPSGTNIGKTVLGLSAGFAFAYLVSVAAALKYRNPSKVDRFPISIKASQFFYDTSINVFGIYFLVLLVQWLDAHLLHLPNTILVWPIYLLLFSVIYAVARVAWVFAQRGIEWHYELANQPEATPLHKKEKG